MKRTGLKPGRKSLERGTCACGCGQPTPMASKTNASRGAVKGQPQRFLHGHGRRQSPVDYLVDSKTGCWVWQLSKHPDGYGLLTFKGVPGCRAHRVYYEREVGPVPEGLELDHLCRNKACVNPAHLEPVTHAENMRRTSRLTADQFTAIKAAKGTYRQIAERFGISPGYVGDIRRGRTW